MGVLEAAALIYSQNSCPHDVCLSKSFIKSAVVVQKGCLVAEQHLGKVAKVAKKKASNRGVINMRQLLLIEFAKLTDTTHANAQSINADVMRE